MALKVLHNFQRDLIKIKGDEAYGHKTNPLILSKILQLNSFSNLSCHLIPLQRKGGHIEVIVCAEEEDNKQYLDSNNFLERDFELEYPESPVHVKSNHNPLPSTVAISTKRQTSPTDKVPPWEGQLEAETQSNDRDESNNDILQEGSPKEKNHPVKSDQKGAYYAAQSILTPKQVVNVQEFVDSNKNKNEESFSDGEVNKELQSTSNDSNYETVKTPNFINKPNVSMSDEQENFQKHKDNRSVKHRENEGDLNDTEIANENYSEGASPTQKHQKLTERNRRTINTTINKGQEKGCDPLAKNRKKNRLDETEFNRCDENLTVTEALQKSPLGGTTIADHPQDISDLNSTYTVNTIDLHDGNISVDNEGLNEEARDDPSKTGSSGITSKDSKNKCKLKSRVKEAQSKKNFCIDEKDEKSNIKAVRTNAKKKTVKKSVSRKPATKLQEVANTPKESSDTGEQNGVNSTENLHQNLTYEKEKGGRGSKSQKKRETLSEMSNIDTKRRSNEVHLSHEQSVSKIPRKKRNVKILEANDKKQSNKLVEALTKGTNDRQKENRKGNNGIDKNVQKDGHYKKQEDEVEKKPTRSSARAAAKAASVKISETAYSDLSSPKRKRGRPRKK